MSGAGLAFARSWCLGRSALRKSRAGPFTATDHGGDRFGTGTVNYLSESATTPPGDQGRHAMTALARTLIDMRQVETAAYPSS